MNGFEVDTRAKWMVVSYNRHSRNQTQEDLYIEQNRAMLEAINRDVPGYLGRKVVKTGSESISLIYFESYKVIKQWRDHCEHVKIKGGAMKNNFYEEYEIAVTKVVEMYGCNK